MALLEKTLEAVEPYLLPQADCAGVKARRACRAALALAFAEAVSAALAAALWPDSLAKALPLSGILWLLLLRMDFDASFSSSLKRMGAVAGALAAGMSLASLGQLFPEARLPLLLASVAASFLARARWKPFGAAAASFLIAFLFSPLILAKDGLPLALSGILAVLCGFLGAYAVLPRRTPERFALRLSSEAAETASKALDVCAGALERKTPFEVERSLVSLERMKSAAESFALELPEGPAREALCAMASSLARLERSVAMAASAAGAMIALRRFNPDETAKPIEAARLAAKATSSGSERERDEFKKALEAARTELLDSKPPQPEGRPFILSLSFCESLERAEANAAAMRKRAEAVA